MALIPAVQLHTHNNICLKPCAFTFTSPLPKIELAIHSSMYLDFMLLKANIDVDPAQFDRRIC